MNYTALKVNITWRDDVSLEDAEEYYVTDEFDYPSYIFVKVPTELMEERQPKDLRNDLIAELEDLYDGTIDDIAIFKMSPKAILPRAKTLVWTERGLVGRE